MQQLRTPLSRVLGLGSAKDGTSHWWAQRVSAIAIGPLLLWFGIATAALPDYSYTTVTQFVASPIVTVLLLLLTGTGLYHAKLGLQVVIEDYVHGGTKIAALIAVNFAVIGLTVAAMFSILRVALTTA
ncbi:MAG: succinate dehydrogenase, hydrophobic membrane anchor protein [Pseudomonadota bacterium]